jgi:uncharacterized protein YbjQ (UPF0145 family)
MAKCAGCGGRLALFEANSRGLCTTCADAERNGAIHSEPARMAKDRRRFFQQWIDHPEWEKFDELPASTVDSMPGREISEVVDLVAAEVAFGMNALKDIATAWRDTFGGRSNALQRTMKDARDLALLELRKAAWQAGADGLIGVRLDYTSIPGTSAVVVCATGTAVRLAARQ